MWWEYLVCAGIGALIGAGELISRYRDNPGAALASGSAMVYVGLNAAASAVAFGLIRAMDWRFGAAPGSPTLKWLQILVGGFGAMALFRSSLFMVRIGGSDIGIGPVGFLQVVLDAADRGVDRNRASDRAVRVSEIMFEDGKTSDMKFDEAAVALPTLCLALMQNASAQEQERLGDQVKRLRQSKPIPEEVKLLNLGLALMNFAGDDVLDAAVKAYRFRTEELIRKGHRSLSKGQGPHRARNQATPPVEPIGLPTE